MAKGIGLIGNFKGKVGNMVGYHLSDSNTGNTQGIRVYQPIVKNPKTAAQAEQRAKLAPINATYRALKMVIDRGNEGLPYGNKSRLAWLKQAFKATGMPWYVKGAVVADPVICQITKGSLPSLNYSTTPDGLNVVCSGVTSETQINTIGKLTTALMAGYSFLKEGDQITLVSLGFESRAITSKVLSFILNSTSTDAAPTAEVSAESILFSEFGLDSAGAIIISREGANGEHLRSTEFLNVQAAFLADAPYDADSKAAAIASYQSSASANADWAEESIQ